MLWGAMENRLDLMAGRGNNWVGKDKVMAFGAFKLS